MLFSLSGWCLVRVAAPTSHLRPSPNLQGDWMGHRFGAEHDKFSCWRVKSDQSGSIKKCHKSYVFLLSLFGSLVGGFLLCFSLPKPLHGLKRESASPQMQNMYIYAQG